MIGGRVRKGNAVITFRWCPVVLSTATSIILRLLVIFNQFLQKKISELYLEEIKEASFCILSMSLLKYTLLLYAMYSEILKYFNIKKNEK
jgi:hypothetical protein